MFLNDIIDMTQPVVHKSDTFLTQGCHDTTASIMTAHDDVLYLQHIDGKLDDRKGVEVGMDNNIGNIAMDKDFSWSQPHKFLGGNPAVRASNPEILWLLLNREFFKKAGVLGYQTLRPRLIIREKICER